MYDVQPQLYTTVIREMIRHENDVTNHRIMWLLIGQGFIANAFVTAEGAGQSADLMLTLVGILVTLSAFVMLYKSYQARDISSSWVSTPSRAHCRSNTCHSWDGRECGSKAGGGMSGSVPGSGTPVMCWNRGYSCRASSCSCGSRRCCNVEPQRTQRLI